MLTKFLLYTSDPNLAKAITGLLRQSGGFEILPPCASLADLNRMMACCPPDLALLDFDTELSFAAVTKLVRETDTKLILWVNSVSTELALRAMQLGIHGILRKSLTAALQIKCLETVRAGQPWFEKVLLNPVVPAPFTALTAEERLLVELLTEGWKNKEIGREMAMTEAQVAAYLTRLFHKIGVKDRFELALYGLKHLPLRDLSGADAAPLSNTEIEAIA